MTLRMTVFSLACGAVYGVLRRGDHRGTTMRASIAITAIAFIVVLAIFYRSPAETAAAPCSFTAAEIAKIEKTARITDTPVDVVRGIVCATVGR